MASRCMLILVIFFLFLWLCFFFLLTLAVAFINDIAKNAMNKAWGFTRCVEFGELDGFIEWHMQRGGLPGVAAAIIGGGSILWVGTYG